MAERADALIIGGGVIGASIAYHLALRGLKPVVFDRDLLGSGNTGRSAGGIRAQFTTEINIKLSLYSIAFYERFREILGADAEFHQVGISSSRRHVAAASSHFHERVGVPEEVRGRRLAPDARRGRGGMALPAHRRRDGRHLLGEGRFRRAVRGHDRLRERRPPAGRRLPRAGGGDLDRGERAAASAG